MDTREDVVYDVVGIGFGPSNLSLAVALEDLGAAGDRALTTHFFESQPAFGWHRNMLLPSAKMQVSFLKDLVTFRDPSSRFSFVSYLHESGRLARFVNNCDFFPTRREFHDYLEWVESSFADRVSYGTRVTEVRPPNGLEPGETAEHLRVRAETGSSRAGSRWVRARNVVLATGLVPNMPDGVDRDEHVWHSAEFLDRFERTDTSGLTHVAVVGAGQSAAEIVRFVYDHVPDATVTAIMPSYGYSIADNTPFANRVFDPHAIDDYYHGDEHSKESFWKYHKNTNYAVVDDEVIRDLHRRAYDDEVSGAGRLHFLELSRMTDVKRSGEDTRITVYSSAADRSYDLDVDLVVCATGYEPMRFGDLLGPLDDYFVRDERGRYGIERDYRVTTTARLRSGVYLQGGTEHTHGLSSSLLSNLAVRSGEIAQSIMGHTTSTGV